MAESQFASPAAVRRRPAASASVAAASVSPAGEPLASPAPAAPAPAAAPSVATAAVSSSTPADDSEDERALSAAAAAVRAKLAWAAGQLEAATSVESSLHLVGLIRACADALQALRRPAAVRDATVV